MSYTEAKLYASRGTPWGMIQARKERDDLSGSLGNLKDIVLTAIDDALAELEKPRGSKAKVKDILEALRLHLNPYGTMRS